MEKGYEEAYYKNYDIGSKTVSYLESPELRKFHASVARELTAHFQPETVLDAGCAMGVLVSEFVKLGVKAYGLDFSEYAVTHADPLARDNCYHGSLASEFPAKLPARFDLVTCMEVVEHMSPEDGKAAIANLCKVTDTVIFCSTPDDYLDPTHINVQQREYWAACFAENGFYDDLAYRPLFLADYAVCYRKRSDWLSQVRDYERYIQQTDHSLKDFRDSHYRALEKEHEKAVAEWTKTAADLAHIHQSYLQLKAVCDEKTEQLQRNAEDKNRLWEKMAQQYAPLLEECDRLRDQKRDLENQLQLYQNRAQRAEEAEDRLDCECRTLVQRCAELENAYQQSLQCLNASQCKVAALESSLSWRITTPLRWAKLMIKRVIGRSARAVFRMARELVHAGRRTKTTVTRYQGNWPPRGMKRPSGQKPASVAVDCRRLGIYTFFDKDGIVDDYVVYFLKALSDWTDKILVISNGPLEEAEQAKLEQIGCQVQIRENRGFDAWGVKFAIDQLGSNVLAQYDEVIIANNTLLGPVRSLEDMFSEMSRRELDFWGIASHPGMPDMDPFGCNPYGYIPEHIQSFFYVIRRRMLTGEAFRRFWAELPQLPDYNAAVGMYETVMTRYFADAGYTWSCYMDSDAYYDMTDNPLIAMPMEALRDWNSPFFKRRAFFQDYDYLTTYTGQQSASCLMQYLQEETEYPLEMVWKNLIRTCHMSDLTQNLHLSLIFDRDNAYTDNAAGRQLKAALFMHIYDHTMADMLAGYASTLPAEADIFISTVSAEKKAAIENAFAKLPNRVEIRVLPNRGRDVSALLTSFRDVVMQYDVACVTHDKKTGYLKPQTVGEGFAYMGYENILASSAFVDQVLGAFAKDPFLGMLYAPDPNHADFATHIGLEWGANFECTKQLAQELKLQVPMDQNHPPMAPFGSSFWFRTAAMKPLFDKPWTYEDFPAEPFHMTDGSILHAIERIYPYVAQHAGYYSALLAAADYAAVDIGNLAYYTQQYAHACFENGIANRFIAVRDLCSMRLGPAVTETGTAPQGQKHSKIRRIAGKVRSVLTRWAYE